MLVLLIFIISTLTLGTYAIGPFSIRVYAGVCAIIFLLYKIIWQKKDFNLPYSSIVIYCLFLFFTLVAKVFSGPYETDGFFKDLLAMHLIAIVSFVCADILIVKQSQVRIVLMLLIAIGVINSIVSILQYYGNPVGFAIGQFFASESTTDIEAYFTYSVDAELGTLSVPGIFGYGASNGGMNATLCILSLYFVFGENRRYRPVAVACFLICFFGSFIIQERSPMGLLVVCSLFVIWKYSSRKIIFALCVLIGVILLSYDVSAVFGPEYVGRFSNIFEIDDNRQRLIDNALAFISQHWFLGGDYLYHQTYGMTPHNFILHAFIYSGFIGALIVICLFFKIVYDIISILMKDKCGTPAFFLGCALIIFLVNGFTHSSSLITGDTIIWLLYGLSLRSFQLSS